MTLLIQYSCIEDINTFEVDSYPNQKSQIVSTVPSQVTSR